MEKRQDAQNAIIQWLVGLIHPAVRIEHIDLPRIGRDILVAQHCAFRRAGSAPGIL